MPWQIRSLAEASQRVRGAFRQYMPGTDASLKNNFVTVTAKVLAALSHEFELRMAYLARQLFASTATGEFLARHGSDVGIFRKPSSAASGLIHGIAPAGVTYPAGIRFLSGNVVYLSTASASADLSGNLELAVAAQSNGSVTNRDVDGILALADPVLWPDLGAEWTVGSDGLGGGADREDEDSLRARILFRKRNPPGGGKLSDYESIALSVPGVLKAWAFRAPLAPGFLVIHFLFEGRVDFIPQPGDVAAVQAAIDAQRLVRVDDSVATAPVARPVNVEIEGLAFDTPEIRAGIERAIRAMFLNRCRPGIAGDTFTVSRSWFSEAISGVTGEDRHELIEPATDIMLTNGQFPTLGTVTYGA